MVTTNALRSVMCVTLIFVSMLQLLDYVFMSMTFTLVIYCLNCTRRIYTQQVIRIILATGCITVGLLSTNSFYRVDFTEVLMEQARAQAVSYTHLDVHKRQQFVQNFYQRTQHFLPNRVKAELSEYSPGIVCFLLILFVILTPHSLHTSSALEITLSYSSFLQTFKLSVSFSRRVNA